MAGLDFAAWEFFRALIKRNHPERMTSLVHAHTLLPCPLLCPHSHASRGSGRQGCRWRSPRQRQILCVCQQAKCRLRAFLAFPPLLVQYCCGCISLGVSFPPELQRQKLTLGGKEEGVLPGHTPPPSFAAVRSSSPPGLSSHLSGFLPCGVGLTGGNFVLPWEDLSLLLSHPLCSLNSSQGGATNLSTLALWVAA